MRTFKTCLGSWVWPFVLAAVILQPAHAIASIDDRRCAGWGPVHDMIEPITGEITIQMSVLETIGSHLGRVGNVQSQVLYGVSADYGSMSIMYDDANPAPSCTLLSLNPVGQMGSLYPAIHTVHLNWVMTLGSLRGLTLRSASTVTMVSEVLDQWPADNMTYTAVTDVYFVNVDDPTDTVLMFPMAGTVGTISHTQTTIPTLNEWGMIIFCVLLFGWMAWMVVRRKRSVTVGI